MSTNKSSHFNYIGFKLLQKICNLRKIFDKWTYKHDVSDSGRFANILQNSINILMNDLMQQVWRVWILFSYNFAHIQKIKLLFVL